MPAVRLEDYRRLTLAFSVAGAALFGAGLVTLVQGGNPGLAAALMVAGAAAALATSLVQIEGAPPAVPASLLLLSRKDCALCDEARALLEGLRKEVPFDLWEADVDADAGLRGRFGEAVPVVLRGAEEISRGPLDEARVRTALAGGAAGRVSAAPPYP